MYTAHMSVPADIAMYTAHMSAPAEAYIKKLGLQDVHRTGHALVLEHSLCTSNTAHAVCGRSQLAAGKQQAWPYHLAPRPALCTCIRWPQAIAPNSP